MNPEAQEELSRILTINPEELNNYEIKFLNARRDYLNKEQRRIYASVLVDEDAPNILDQVNSDNVVEKPSTTVEAPKVETTAPVAPTRKELSDKAIELGVDGALVKKAKTNADIQALIDSAGTKAPEQTPPVAPEQPATDPFAGGNADPDAKV